MPLMKVRLELARNDEFPEGSANHGYEFNAPLSDDGHISKQEWNEHASDCTVRRFWDGEDEEHGRLIHFGDRWVFHYTGMDPDDDEPIFRMGEHTFVPGEYVSITEHDGVQRTFKVANVARSPLD